MTLLWTSHDRAGRMQPSPLLLPERWQAMGTAAAQVADLLVQMPLTRLLTALGGVVKRSYTPQHLSAAHSAAEGLHVCKPCARTDTARAAP